MMLDWFKSRDAAQAGTALADQFASQRSRGNSSAKGTSDQTSALKDLLRRADREVRGLKLNFYKKVKFANSFKWRLIENGIAREVADRVTESLVLHLSQSQPDAAQSSVSEPSPNHRPDIAKARHLVAKGDEAFARGAYSDAVALYNEALEFDSRNVDGLNNCGAALMKLGDYAEAEDLYRQSLAIAPDYAQAHSNLGHLLRLKGDIAAAETAFRRALKLNPTLADARSGLGFTLTLLNRPREAHACFKKALRLAPRNADAMVGLGQIQRIEGRFAEAEVSFNRALQINPGMASACAAMAGLRKMTPADAAWFERAEKMANGNIAPLEESDLRFAMGKYCDDTQDFEVAFRHFKRGNELMKSIAPVYDRDLRARFVEHQIRAYPKAPAEVGAGASTSSQPVFLVGMMRAGTSLAEQIIASHPRAKGVGELGFWGDAARAADATGRPLDAAGKESLAQDYLRVLARDGGAAERVVDKTPFNSDYLGLIHSVFPKARIIYMRRDPLDTCLSCYFQQFSSAMNFAMDLGDLAHYYREHTRLMEHWKRVLPPGTMLDLSYEDLVADQEGSTRKLLAFLGLDWNDRCLDFHATERAVVTASAWQVRQKMYRHAVERWRHYEKHLGPLKKLSRSDKHP